MTRKPDTDRLVVVHSWRTLIMAIAISEQSSGSRVTTVCSRGFGDICRGLEGTALKPCSTLDITRIHGLMYGEERYIPKLIESVLDVEFEKRKIQRGAKLIVPHMLDPWSRYLSRRDEVQEVDFMEEGVKLSAKQMNIFMLREDLARSHEKGEKIGVIDKMPFDEQAFITGDCKVNSKLRSAVLYCTSDLEQFQGFPKKELEDRQIEKLAKELVESHKGARSLTRKAKRETVLVFLGSKHHLDTAILGRDIGQACSECGEVIGEIVYKPHPSCPDHYSEAFRNLFKRNNVELLERDFPIDALLFDDSGANICWAGNTSSLLVTAKRRGHRVLVVGHVRENKNFDRCRSSREVYSRMMGL